MGRDATANTKTPYEFMDTLDLFERIQKGESSTVQFKERLPHQDSLAQEMSAFSNDRGGLLVIGVNDKTGALNGLSFDEIQSTNRQLVNVASQSIFPPIIITTETVSVNGNNLIVVGINEGFSKPYKDRLDSIYIKNGSDKRRVSSNEEIARLLQSSKAMFADEIPIEGTSIADIDVLQTMAQHTLPYKGLGTGIVRAINNYPEIKFLNDQENERFVVTIKKPGH